MYAKQMAGHGQQLNKADTHAAAAPPPQPIRAVPDAIESLERQIMALGDRLGELHSRLQPVLGPAIPTGENEAARTDISDTVSGRVRQAADAVRGLTRIVQDLLERVEV